MIKLCHITFPACRLKKKVFHTHFHFLYLKKGSISLQHKYFSTDLATHQEKCEKMKKKHVSRRDKDTLRLHAITNTNIEVSLLFYNLHAAEFPLVEVKGNCFLKVPKKMIMLQMSNYN